MSEPPQARDWRRFAILIVAIGFLALAVRVPAAFWWQSRLDDADALQFGDSHGYLILADRIAQGESYQYGWKHASVFRAPGYPLLLAPLVHLSNDAMPVMWARCLNAVLGAMTAIGIGFLARRMFDDSVGLIAALMIAFYPGAITTSFLVLAETPFGLLMVLSLFGAVGCWRASERVAWVDAILLGAMAGAATLIRPSWLFFFPAIAVVGMIRLRTKNSWTTWLLALLMYVLILAPWTMRNARTVGQPVPTTLQTGSSLFDGLSDSADGSSNMDFVIDERLKYLRLVRERYEMPEYEYRQEMVDESGQPTVAYWPNVMLNVQQIETAHADWNFEVGFDTYLRRQAIKWAGDHPSQALGLAGVKLARMWNPVPNRDDLGNPVARVGVALSFITVMLLACWGLFHRRGRSEVWMVCVAPAVYFSAIHMVFVSSIRYRQPAMLTIAIMGAMGVLLIWRYFRSPRRGELSADNAAQPDAS